MPKRFTVIAAFLALAAARPGYVSAQQAVRVVPQLPADGDTVRTLNPLFTWLAVPPLAGGRYRFRLYELLPGQSPQAAVLANPVYHEADGLETPAYAYPASAPSLQPGRRYAWQLWGAAPEMPLAPGEPAEFATALPALPQPAAAPRPPQREASVYLLLPAPETGATPVTGRRLCFTLHSGYHTEGRDTLLGYQILSVPGDTLYETSAGQGFYYGRNAYCLDLDALPGFQPEPGRHYLLRVFDRKRRPYYMHFKLR